MKPGEATHQSQITAGVQSSAEGGTAPRPWRRALLWLAFLAPFFFASYGAANWLAGQRADVGSIVFAWERHIPFLPWTIVPYWIIDLLYGLSLLLPRTARALDAHAKRLLAVQVISVACFIVFPLRFTFERPETAGLFGWLFDVLLGFDKPFNQAPSLHIGLLVILWSIFRLHARGPWRWIVHIVGALIAVSVLTTYQHHFIDVPTGLLAGAFCVAAFPLRGGRLVQRDPKRWSLAGRYGVGAVVFAAGGVAIGGSGLWLLWPAAALGWVAVAYLRGDATLLGKGDGRMEPAVVLVLAPYLLAAWINSRGWTRNAPEASAIVPGLWLSRVPAPAEAARYAALVDLSAELPVAPGGRPVHSVPLLDLLVPEAAQIDAAAAAISAARAQGDTLVFCALGYSRSAIAVVAWLLDQGLAADVDAAMEQVRQARPALVLTPAHRARLLEWQQRRGALSTPAPDLAVLAAVQG